MYGTMEISNSGVLHIGGISTVDLVEKYGTPLLVFDEWEIRKKAREYVKAFNKYYPNSRTVYASKAFLNQALCYIIEEEGLGLDVVSGGELYIALKAGFPPEKIFFHGNNKSNAEIKMAVEAGIGRFMLDNLKEARYINKVAGRLEKSIKAILRVTPGIEAHTHEFIQTGQIDSKFGVSVYRDQALKAIEEIIRMDNIELTGVHVHIGSQIFNLTSFSRTIDVMFEFMNNVRDKTGYILKELDLGGGLGIPYTEDEPDPGIDEYARLVSEKVREKSHEFDYPLPVIINEPGRSIIGTAGTTLYTVGTVKEIPFIRKYLAVDGGMTDNIRPALYGAEYDAILANRADDEREEIVSIAGKCCESGDILIHDIKMPEAREGDIIAIPCTGAYTYAMSSNYNGLRRPAVVLVNDGNADLIIKRESYEDLIKNDIVPARLRKIKLKKVVSHG